MRKINREELLNIISNHNKYKGLKGRIFLKTFKNIIDSIDNEIRIVKKRYLFFWVFPNDYEKKDYKMIKILKKSKLYNVELIKVEDIENSMNIKYRHYTYSITKK